MDFDQEEYLEHRENYDGFCTTCQDWTSLGGVEPDAREYECDICGEHTVMGAEEWLMENV